MASAVQEALGALLGAGFSPAKGPVLGVASPVDESELATTLTIATRAGVPIVPQGSASSPYGASSADRGLVISFQHLNGILDLDASRQLVTVESGVLWQDLIEHLALLGLSPRVYPSSRAFSTVGGFVAQGGAGVGSFEFGTVDESVESVRVLDAAGRPRDVSGPDIELVVGAEGRTGLLSRVTLRLQPSPNVAPVVGLFDRCSSIEAAIVLSTDLQLPLWSVSFIDPIASAARVDHGGPRQPLLPQGRYAALFLCRLDGSKHAEGLVDAIRRAGGQVGQEPASVDRWVDRFMGLQVLRTTLLPLQFRLPAGHLDEVAAGIPSQSRRELGFEGVAVSQGREIVVRFLFASRALSPARNLELAGALLDVVMRAGGTPYATGAFFVDQAALAYGAERLRRLQQFRSQQDERSLLNPGRAFPD